MKIGTLCRNCKKPVQPGQNVRIITLGVLEDYNGELELDCLPDVTETYVEHDYACKPRKG